MISIESHLWTIKNVNIIVQEPNQTIKDHKSKFNEIQNLNHIENHVTIKGKQTLKPYTTQDS